MDEHLITRTDLKTYYDAYFDSPAQLDWYALCAIDKARHVTERCAGVPHRTVLDVGCGDGSVLLNLDRAEFGAELAAVDVSESGLDALRRKPFRRLTQTRSFDGFVLPFGDGAFDLAILSHVVEHVEHPRLLLYEAARVARHVYVEVPLELRWFERGLPDSFVLDDTGHINHFTPRLIRLLLQTSGLDVVSQRTVLFSKTVHRKGSRYGALAYYAKAATLGVSEPLATGLFTLASSILCRAKPQAPKVTVEIPSSTSLLLSKRAGQAANRRRAARRRDDPLHLSVGDER